LIPGLVAGLRPAAGQPGYPPPIPGMAPAGPGDAQRQHFETLRQQGGIAPAIGYDLSTAAVWRPFMHQNIVVRGSAAMLVPGRGFRQLFVAENRAKRFASVLLNLVLSY
ncbi:MAG: hypothetical protein ACK4MT_08650, partial [Thermaurantiacus tibetensis]